MTKNLKQIAHMKDFILVTLLTIQIKLYSKSVVQIGEDKDMECTEKRKTSTGTILNIEFNTNICLPCKNGDFPTGIHRCVFCNKSVHLFGCSVNLVDSKEGHRESRICLSCFNQSEENNAEERWQRKNIYIYSALH